MSVSRRGVAFFVMATVAFGSLSGLALAQNTHTVGEWYHGLGDGTDNDKYLHPFNHNTNGHAHSNFLSLARKRLDGSFANLFRQTCTCKHNHRNWDTNPYNECLFVSNHESQSNHPLNLHVHYHHNGLC